MQCKALFPYRRGCFLWNLSGQVAAVNRRQHAWEFAYVAVLSGGLLFWFGYWRYLAKSGLGPGGTLVGSSWRAWRGVCGRLSSRRRAICGKQQGASSRAVCISGSATPFSCLHLVALYIQSMHQLAARASHGARGRARGSCRAGREGTPITPLIKRSPRYATLLFETRTFLPTDRLTERLTAQENQRKPKHANCRISYRGDSVRPCSRATHADEARAAAFA